MKTTINIANGIKKGTYVIHLIGTTVTLSRDGECYKCIDVNPNDAFARFTAIAKAVRESIGG